MDRVLLWNFYVVPQFTYGFERYARWDRFSHPDPLPKYGVSGFPDLWWWDADKAAKIGQAVLKRFFRMRAASPAATCSVSASVR